MPKPTPAELARVTQQVYTAIQSHGNCTLQTLWTELLPEVAFAATHHACQVLTDQGLIAQYGDGYVLTQEGAWFSRGVA